MNPSTPQEEWTGRTRNLAEARVRMVQAAERIRRFREGLPPAPMPDKEGSAVIAEAEADASALDD